MFPDGTLAERGNEEDPDAIGLEIVGVWKNGTIQPYVPEEENSA